MHSVSTGSIGIDLINLARVQHLAQRYAQSIAQRILTRKESQVWTASTDKPGMLAKYIAAKEACFKASAQGVMGMPGFRQFEIHMNDDRFTGQCGSGMYSGSFIEWNGHILAHVRRLERALATA